MYLVLDIQIQNYKINLTQLRHSCSCTASCTAYLPNAFGVTVIPLAAAFRNKKKCTVRKTLLVEFRHVRH